LSDISVFEAVTVPVAGREGAHPVTANAEMRSERESILHTCSLIIN
jgi:hypothetical protein